MRNTIILFTIAMLALAGTAHAQPDSLWSRTFGGRDDDKCFSMIQTADGGYALAGYTESFGGGRNDSPDFWLVKTNADGDSLWSRTFGGRGDDWCSSIIQTADGGYALAGTTRSFGAGEFNMWLVKTDADGDSLWSQTFVGRADNCCNSMIQTADGGYALAGHTYSVGGGDMWLVKTDTDGDSLWSRTFGGENAEWCISIIQTADGGYALAGASGAGRLDMWLVRTDADGDSLWSRAFGGENEDFCYSIIQTADGGYALAGYTESFGAGSADMWLVRTDADGDSLWSRTFGGESDDWCNSIIQTEDGGYALAGYTRSFGAGSADMWLVKTGPDPVSVPPDPFILHPSSFILLESYPNPFNASTNFRFNLPYNGQVTLKIYDTNGRMMTTLADGWFNTGSYNLTWNARNMSSGLYFARLASGSNTRTTKLMLIR